VHHYKIVGSYLYAARSFVIFFKSIVVFNISYRLSLENCGEVTHNQLESAHIVDFNLPKWICFCQKKCLFESSFGFHWCKFNFYF